MKSEKGIIEIFVIGIVVILFIILCSVIWITINEEKDYGINLKIAIWAGKEKEVYLLSLMNICLGKDKIVLQKIH